MLVKKIVRGELGKDALKWEQFFMRKYVLFLTKKSLQSDALEPPERG